MNSKNSTHAAGPTGSLSDSNDVSRNVADSTDRLTPSETIARLRGVNQELTGALESRIVIEQAKGVLAERYSLSLDEAFALLREAARSSRTALRSLAETLSQRDDTPEVVLAALTRPERWSARTDSGAKHP